MITINIRKSNKANGDYSMFVSFPYDNRIIETIREFPSRYWDKDTKEWEVPIKKLEELTTKLNMYDFEIHGYVNLSPIVCEKPTNFEFKTTPFEHQIEGFNYGLEHDRWLLADEQGLGKTKQVIDICCAKKLQKGYKHCLIICGVNGLKWNWKNEIETHSNESGYILGQKIKKGKITIGSTKDKIADLDTILTAPETIPDYFLITNVESLRDEEISSKIANLTRDNTIGVIAFDECHKCLDYNTMITTDVGDYTIGEIVENHLSVKVPSYNTTLNEVEWKQVVDWHKNVVLDKLMELKIEDKYGIHTIKCTKDHKIFTSNRGWVEAQNLTSDDNIVTENLPLAFL